MISSRVGFLVFTIAMAVVSVAAQLENIQREPYLTGLTRPVFITNAADGTNRMFVVQQRGLIRVVEPASTTPTTFLDLSGLVSQSGNERGLLGLAFHPDFENNNYFFVNYTRSSDGATVIERYRAINNNTVGDPKSGVPIITIAQDFSNHNGGHIDFDADDNLFIGMGDGGSGNDPNNRAQNINSLLGKMLRITPSLAANVGQSPYTNPPDNPYVGVAGADEIYAIGLRNPYRWSFDRGGTNELWAGDVGQNAIEEVDIVRLGKNYGWRVYEGNQCTNNDPGLCTPSNYEPPVFQYSQAGPRCAVTGGYVYRGNRGTFPQGSYIYGDYCTGEYWLWDGASQVLIEDTPRNISGFGEDEAGELYLVNLNGTVEKIINTNPLKAVSDFDGDGTTDISVFRPSGGVWYSYLSATGTYLVQAFGAAGDIPVPQDWDGDNITDISLYRPSTNNWFIFQSSDNTIDNRAFGEPGDLPVAGDYLSDDLPELAVFRPSEGTWYIVNVPGGDGSGGFTSTSFGVDGDIPTIGDYDGDGKDDLAVFRPSTGVWYNKDFIDPDFRTSPWGISTDIAAPGDFDGDGSTDLSIYRPSEGNWYTLLSASGGLRVTRFGIDGDIPTVGDYDGDGTHDVSVWRPATGVWWVLRSSEPSYFSAPLGVSTDLPIPAYASH